MKVLMVGVDRTTKGGMWTVVENYLRSEKFNKNVQLKYIPTSVTGSLIKRMLFSFFAIIRVLIFTIFNNYEILHVHMSERGSVFRKNIIMKISKIRNAKIIIHMHGAEFEKWFKLLKPSKQNKVIEILNSCDKILILGNYWEKFIGSLMKDKSKIVILYNSVYVPNKYYYNEKSKKVLFLGLIGKRKGIYDLLNSVLYINKNEKFIGEICLYGPDDTEEGIDNLIEKEGLQNYVKYCGWLSNEEKEKVFKETSINILPSYNEGLPMTILETMAYGIPNISTSVAAIPEAINETNGMLVEPGNIEELAKKLNSLLKDTSKRKEMSYNAYKITKEKFSIDNHIKKLLDVYQQLVVGE